MIRLRAILLAAMTAAGACAQLPVRVIFLEAVSGVDTRGAEIQEQNALYRRVTDSSRYTPWLNNDAAARAFQLYRMACDIAQPGGGVPDYYVALVKGGNHAATGFRIQDGTKIEEHPRQPYILLDPVEARFQDTLLHETGHMAMAMLAGGRRLDGRQMSAIPHSTAALSDRSTAFSEGYAIHLETLQAHVASSDAARRQYHRGMVLFGDGDFHNTEYFHHSTDLTTYSQSVARYFEIRENNFSFESAFQGPDYLRVQLEKPRDFATPRDADQLLQSEGYYGSFFFLWAMRGESVPAAAEIDNREKQMMRAMHAAFQANQALGPEPWLLHVVGQYMTLFPDEKSAIADALNDTSHGVFVDPGAAAMWKEHYLGALQLDRDKLNIPAILAARKKWREQVLADPAVLLSRLGPEIACTIPSAKVRLAAFGREMTVRFDVNTVQPGILRLIPKISEAEIFSWISARPFAGRQDFAARSGVKKETLAELKF
jgi:hypothetical protein